MEKPVMSKLGIPSISLQQLADFLSQTKPDQLSRFNELREIMRGEDYTVEQHEEFLKMRLDVTKEFNEAQRLEQLKMLGEGDFTAADVIRAGKFTKKEVMAAVKEIFANEESGDSILLLSVATPNGDVKVGTGRWPQAVSEEVKSWGVEKLVASLTENGRKFLAEAKVGKKGDKAGQTLYPNIDALAKRLGMDADAIKTALSL